MKEEIKNNNLSNGEVMSLIKRITQKYPFIKRINVGKDFRGENIEALLIGKGEKTTVFLGGTEKEDYFTSLILLRFCERVGKAYIKNRNIAYYSINELLKNTRLVVIPKLTSFNKNLQDDTTYNKIKYEKYLLKSFLEKISPNSLYIFKKGDGEIYCNCNENVGKELLIGEALCGVTGYTLVKNNFYEPTDYLNPEFLGENNEPCFIVKAEAPSNKDIKEQVKSIYENLEKLMVLGMVL